jgi:hypothetical protein
MMLGLLAGVIFYRPIFGIFLEDTNVKEWVNRDGGVQPKPLSNSLVVDTVINDKVGVRITEKRDIKWDYQGIRFQEKRIDTLYPKYGYTTYPPLSALGQQGPDIRRIEFERVADHAPVYSNITLSPSIKLKFVFLVWIMIIFVTMVYGPIAAFLVEMFPTRIRYTSMSLPYHIGNGVFGGLVPFIGALLTATYTKDPLVGLWYPIGVAILCFAIGTMYLTNKIDRNIND